MKRYTKNRLSTWAFSLMIAAALALLSGGCSKQGQDKPGGANTPGTQQVSAEQTDTQKLKSEWSEAMQTLKSYSVEQRDQARDVAKQKLAAMDERIERLEGQIDEKWDEWSEEARQRHKAVLQTLREQRTELQKWYDSMKHSSVDAWGKVKQGFINAYDALSSSVGKAQSEFNNQDEKQN